MFYTKTSIHTNTYIYIHTHKYNNSAYNLLNGFHNSLTGYNTEFKNKQKGIILVIVLPGSLSCVNIFSIRRFSFESKLEMLYLTRSGDLSLSWTDSTEISGETELLRNLDKLTPKHETSKPQSLPRGSCVKTYFGPPHSTAEAFTNRIGCSPTGSMLRVLFSTASKTAAASFKNTQSIRNSADRKISKLYFKVN